jgi:hypothetical protein
MGFEPTYDGFANHCLTAWLPHRRERAVYRFMETVSSEDRGRAFWGNSAERTGAAIQPCDFLSGDFGAAARAFRPRSTAGPGAFTPSIFHARTSKP